MAGAKPEGTLQVTERKDVSRERQLADIALDPLFGSAALSTTFTKGSATLPRYAAVETNLCS